MSDTVKDLELKIEALEEEVRSLEDELGEKEAEVCPWCSSWDNPIEADIVEDAIRSYPDIGVGYSEHKLKIINFMKEMGLVKKT